MRFSQSLPLPRARRTIRALVLAALLLAAAASAPDHHGGGARAAAREDPPATIEMLVRRGLLTMSVRNAPLAQVLRAMADQANFRVIITGDAGELVSSSFTDIPLDAAIRELAGDRSWVIIYDARSGTTGAKSLSEVYILGGKHRPTTAEGSEPVEAVVVWGDRDARLRTVREIARQPDAAASDALIQVLLEDEDPVIRGTATIGLGRVGGTQAIEALISALADEESSVRTRVVQALGKIGDERAVGAIGEVLKDDPDPRIRRAAVRALGRQPSEEALRALEEATADSDVLVRKTAVLILERWAFGADARQSKKE